MTAPDIVDSGYSSVHPASTCRKWDLVDADGHKRWKYSNQVDLHLGLHDITKGSEDILLFPDYLYLAHAISTTPQKALAHHWLSTAKDQEYGANTHSSG